MIQWTVFDAGTAARIAGHLSPGATLRVESGDAMEHALQAEGAVSLVLLPSGNDGQVLLARLERKSPAIPKLFEVTAENLPHFVPVFMPEPAQQAPSVTWTDCNRAPSLENAQAQELSTTRLPEKDQVVDDQSAALVDSQEAGSSPKLNIPKNEEPVTFQAGGFLGLSDEPVYRTDYEPKPRKGWQRLSNRLLRGLQKRVPPAVRK